LATLKLNIKIKFREILAKCGVWIHHLIIFLLTNEISLLNSV